MIDEEKLDAIGKTFYVFQNISMSFLRSRKYSNRKKKMNLYISKRYIKLKKITSN
jgi:hypothetical protein